MFCSYELWLFLQRTQVQFPAATRTLTLSLTVSGLSGHRVDTRCTYTQQTKLLDTENKNKSLKEQSKSTGKKKTELLLLLSPQDRARSSVLPKVHCAMTKANT